MKKPSEVLTLALKQYNTNSFMCHVLSHFYDSGVISANEEQATRHTFLPFIYGTGFGTLSNALYKTDPKYQRTVVLSEKRGGKGHDSPAAYLFRRKWWKTLIKELQAEGK